MSMTKARSKSSKPALKSYNTEQTLTAGICQNNFYNNLRGDSNGHPETKMTFVPIKVNKRNVPISHIFTGEDPSTIKVSKKSQIRYTPSNVIFNDDYFEKNPKINPLKRKRYEMEKTWRENKHPYSNELILSKSKKDMLKRRIDENYNTNPLKINTKEENAKMNEELALKAKKHAIAYNGYLGSKNCTRILGGIVSPRMLNRNKTSNDFNKITNNNFKINERAMMLNWNKDKEVPYYGKRCFRFVPCAGKGMTYA